MDSDSSSRSFGSITDSFSDSYSVESMSTDPEALGYESDLDTESESQSCTDAGSSASSSESDWVSDDDDGVSDDDDDGDGDSDASVHRPGGLDSCLLYEGADLTALDSNILLLQYSLRHGLTQKAFSELLTIVAAHLPESAHVSRSVYKLKKFFTSRFPDVTTAQEYMYCSMCHQLLEGTNGCTNGCSAKTLSFLLIPVASQLRRMLEDPHVWASIQRDRSTQNTESAETIKDLYDGALYRKYEALAEPCDISLQFNTDGVAIFKSSAYSIWPIWLAINELPPNERFSKRNMLLAGLWYAKEKPTMTTYLAPLMKEMNSLYENGIDVQTPAGCMKCHAALLMGSLDLPARAIVTNMKQYNGAYGCCYCEDEGSPRASAPMHRNWPYQENVVMRTVGSFNQNVKDTLAEHHTVKGVKGASILSVHSPFPFPRGIVLDALHFLFLGVVQTLLHYWFDKKHSKKRCSIRSKLYLCEQRLMAIKVPDIITRPPRSLLEFNHWKGSELRAWLLLYSTPVLHGLLPLPYFSHFCYLVAAIHLLLGTSVTNSDLQHAHKFLLKFYSMCGELYGQNFCTMNVHMLRHAAQCVFDWGPLWAYGCFPFEGMNSTLKGFFHGTRNMNKQLAFSYTMWQKMPSLMRMQRAETSRVQLAIDTLVDNKRLKNKLLVGSEQSCWIVGQKNKAVVPSQFIVDINHYLLVAGKTTIAANGTVEVFYRARVGNNLFHCSKYLRVKKRNSFTVTYKESNGPLCYGEIQYFLCVQDCAYAVLKELTIVGTLKDCFSIPHCSLDYCGNILHVTPSTEKLLPLHFLKNKCVHIQVASKSFVAIFPNQLTQD